jgi:hypothetical protein
MRLKPGNPALVNAVTIHPKQVKQPEEVAKLLKPASNNTKLGKGENIVIKGHWRGMPMFQLSLQERASCPSSCKQWDDCYGNNMFGAHRIDHTGERFYELLEAEVDHLAKRYRYGFVVRLHVLGDFPDRKYVEFWKRKKQEYLHMQIFGFSAHTPDSDMGKLIAELNAMGAWIRFSNAGSHPMSANVGTDFDGVTCPVQTGATESCLTCALCWSTPRNINFLPH